MRPYHWLFCVAAACGGNDVNLGSSPAVVPPTGVTVTRTSAAHDAVAGAKAHSVDYVDSSGTTLLEITVFDDQAKTVDVPRSLRFPRRAR